MCRGKGSIVRTREGMCRCKGANGLLHQLCHVGVVMCKDDRVNYYTALSFGHFCARVKD